MHAINWGIQVKKGLLMRKKNKKTFSEKQNLSEQKQKKKKKKKKRLVSFSLGINFNLIVSHLFQLW